MKVVHIEFAPFASKFAFLAACNENIMKVREDGGFQDIFAAPFAFLQKPIQTTVQTKFTKAICNLFCNFHPPTCARERLLSVFCFSGLILKKTMKYCKNLNRALKTGLYLSFKKCKCVANKNARSARMSERAKNRKIYKEDMVIDQNEAEIKAHEKLQRESTFLNPALKERSENRVIELKDENARLETILAEKIESDHHV